MGNARILSFFGLGLLISTFLLLTIPHIAIRLADTNTYILTAQYLLQGKVLYKDIFFTNLPLWPYMAAVFLWLFRGNPYLFYGTALTEICATAVVLFLIFRHMKTHPVVQFLGVMFYLFSFMVLVTSTTQSGIFLASLAATGAYYLYITGRYRATGVVLALMLGIKGYFLPVAAAVLLYDIWVHRKRSLPMLASFVVTLLVIIAYPLITAPQAFLHSLFGFSLGRTGTLDKMNVLNLFLYGDWFLLLPLIYTVIFYRRFTLLHLIVLFCLIFFIGYGELFYLYLNMVLPFLALFMGLFYNAIRERTGWPYVMGGICVFGLLMVLLNGLRYTNNYAYTNRIIDYDGLVQKIQKQQPDRLYGVAEAMPILSYTTGIAPLNSMVDINANLFVKGIYNKTTVTNDLFRHKTLVMMFGTTETVEKGGKLYDIRLPEPQPIYDEKRIFKECQWVDEHPVNWEYGYNRIYLYRCY